MPQPASASPGNVLHLFGIDGRVKDISVQTTPPFMNRGIAFGQFTYSLMILLVVVIRK
jgi:hypothetical protein